MTTYLLYGGVTSQDIPGCQEFFDYFTQLVPKDEVKILMCYFSRPKSDWQKIYERDTARILRNTTKEVIFSMPQDPAKLAELISAYDVVYIAGGDAEPIEALYDQLHFLKTELAGKLYVGSSMGAFMAGTRYVLSPDATNDETLREGIGLLPIQTLCHWNQETKKQLKLDLLSDQPQPILVLDEGQSVVMYQ